MQVYGINTNIEGYDYVKSPVIPNSCHVRIPEFMLRIDNVVINNVSTDDIVNIGMRVVEASIRTDLEKTVKAIKKEISNGNNQRP